MKQTAIVVGMLAFVLRVRRVAVSVDGVTLGSPQSHQLGLPRGSTLRNDTIRGGLTTVSDEGRLTRAAGDLQFGLRQAYRRECRRQWHRAIA